VAPYHSTTERHSPHLQPTRSDESLHGITLEPLCHQPSLSIDPSVMSGNGNSGSGGVEMIALTTPSRVDSANIRPIPEQSEDESARRRHLDFSEFNSLRGTSRLEGPENDAVEIDDASGSPIFNPFT